MAIKNKLFTFDLSTWNHPRRVIIASPVFAVIGVTLTYLYDPSFVNSGPLNFTIHTVLIVGAIYVGVTPLALID